MPTPKAVLGEKHFKALELIERGDLPLKEIAKICGWSEDHFYALYQGNVEKTSNVALLFAGEVDKITARNAKRIKGLTKDLQRNILAKWDAYVKSLADKDLDEKQMKEYVSMYNAIAKATPNVEIGSFSYTKGLSAEDLVNEFRRLKSLASDGGRVSGPSAGGAGQIPVLLGRRSKITKDS